MTSHVIQDDGICHLRNLPVTVAGLQFQMSLPNLMYENIGLLEILMTSKF